MRTLPLLLRIETGTDTEVKVIINPVLFWLAQANMQLMQEIAELFLIGENKEGE